MQNLSAFVEWLRHASPSRDTVLTLVGILAGWLISHAYYLRALSDMKSDADERRRVEELVFRGIESIGDLKYSRDTSGRVVGVSIELRGEAVGGAQASGALSVVPASASSR